MDNPNNIIQSKTKELTQQFGIAFSRIQQIIGELLHGNPTSFDHIIQRFHIPHRIIIAILKAYNPYIDSPKKRTIQINPKYLPQFQQIFAPKAPFPIDSYEQIALSQYQEQIEFIQSIKDQYIVPNQQFDHVGATALTAIKRAIYLNTQYHLTNRRILFLGDHDLSSIALALLRPDLELTVVDVDQRILQFIGQTAQEHNWNIHTHFADFRIEFPRSLQKQFDLIFTDPPYTAPGMDLFLKRALQASNQSHFARILVSYSFSELHPGLGIKVQQAYTNLDLAFEAILPQFNHYLKAEAIGSASSLYICRPTKKSYERIPKKPTSLSHIYTHGKQSEEAHKAQTIFPQQTPIPESLISESPLLFVGFDQVKWKSTNKRSISIPQFFHEVYHEKTNTIPFKKYHQGTLIVHLPPNLYHYLPYVLLASHAQTLILTTPSNHPPLSIPQTFPFTNFQHIQTISSPPFSYTILQPIPTPNAPIPFILHALTQKKHAKLTNNLRETIIQAIKKFHKKDLTKKQTKSIINQTITFPHKHLYLSECPPHQLAQLPTDINQIHEKLLLLIQ